MTNKTVFELIDEIKTPIMAKDRLEHPEMRNKVYSPREALEVALHGYFYIKPGKDTTTFLGKFREIIDRVSEIGSRMLNNRWPYGSFESVMMAFEAEELAKSMFDAEYYEQVLKDADPLGEANPKLLIDYISSFDTEELKYFYTNCIVNGEFLMDIDTTCDVVERLARLCVEAGAKIPRPWTESGEEWEEYCSLMTDNPTYIFDYLKPSEIARILRENLNGCDGHFEYFVRALQHTHSVYEAVDYAHVCSRVIEALSGALSHEEYQYVNEIAMKENKYER
jgi:hypothetical protein